jgi:hypothetical protein
MRRHPTLYLSIIFNKITHNYRARYRENESEGEIKEIYIVDDACN